MPTYAMRHRLGAEAIGTFWLVLGGCGSAVLAASFAGGTGPSASGCSASPRLRPQRTTMAYAVGHVSGGHFNPAVTLGLAAAAFPAEDLLPYVVAQVLGASPAARVFYGDRLRG